ncbi:LapA family protein [Listeria valentina]|uniref:LapA family protein n=1 Tax=Listeria valentina TaxID=2705293 RepID=UPI0014306FEE|nr:lipopolysaccharide assembly LapA domain-containing protein [Listeria valentina]
MKNQWQVILGALLVLLIAIFAVINVDSVEVNFLFAKAEWPLVLVILGSVLVGCLIIFFLNIAKVRSGNKQIKQLKEEKTELTRKLAAAEAMHGKKSTIDVGEKKETKEANEKPNL